MKPILWLFVASFFIACNQKTETAQGEWING